MRVRKRIVNISPQCRSQDATTTTTSQIYNLHSHQTVDKQSEKLWNEIKTQTFLPSDTICLFDLMETDEFKTSKYIINIHSCWNKLKSITIDTILVVNIPFFPHFPIISVNSPIINFTFCKELNVIIYIAPFKIFIHYLFTVLQFNYLNVIIFRKLKTLMFKHFHFYTNVIIFVYYWSSDSLKYRIYQRAEKC